MFNFRNYIYLCTGNKRKWEFRRYNTFEEADCHRYDCDISILIDVPFIIPQLFHGMYLSRYIRKFLDPCLKYNLIKKD